MEEGQEDQAVYYKLLAVIIDYIASPKAPLVNWAPQFQRNSFARPGQDWQPVSHASSCVVGIMRLLSRHRFVITVTAFGFGTDNLGLDISR